MTSDTLWLIFKIVGLGLIIICVINIFRMSIKANRQRRKEIKKIKDADLFEKKLLTVNRTTKYESYKVKKERDDYSSHTYTYGTEFPLFNNDSDSSNNHQSDYGSNDSSSSSSSDSGSDFGGFGGSDSSSSDSGGGFDGGGSGSDY